MLSSLHRIGVIVIQIVYNFSVGIKKKSKKLLVLRVRSSAAWFRAQVSPSVMASMREERTGSCLSSHSGVRRLDTPLIASRNSLLYFESQT